MSRMLMISSDCHAGALPSMYNEYMPAQYRAAADDWWLSYTREMIARTGTFFDQEAVEAYADDAGDAGRMNAALNPPGDLTDDALRAMLNDGSSAFAPRPGEWDPHVRLKELEDDGVAAEVIFPQMAPFGAGLMQYRWPVSREENLQGIRAYNRWLADFCKTNPGRHAGVALINVDDIEGTVQEVRNAKELGLFGGVLLPVSTGEHPFYHHARYEPLWAVCEELEMPLQAHSGWAPDYGDSPSATAMFISEVDMWAHRPFTALMWSGAFENHPNLKYVFTEQGCSWILEWLRVLEFKAANPIFKYFTKDLSLTPTEYFQRQCYMGASFMRHDEGEDRYKIGVDKLLYGTDYPHLEGTWPNTMDALRETFGQYSEAETRAILGTNALAVYDFDLEQLAPIAEKIGPTIADITAAR